MEEDEQEQRRRKVEAGRAKLAHFRQRKTKGDCAHPKKKTAKRKGPAVDAPVQEEGPVATKDGGLLGRGDVCEDASCSDTPEGAQAAQLEDPSGERTGHSEQPQQKLDGDHLEQPEDITKECEQERKLEFAELTRRPKDAVGAQQQVAVGLQWPTETQQPVPSLELEALRLSLSNMHAAQLERMQATLQREKEAALTELRAALNGRHAQELALLRSQQQHQQARAREQHAREREESEQRCHQETAELKEKLQLEMEKNARMLENLKREWEAERELCLENLRRELSAKHRLELESLQDQLENELAQQKAESEKIFQAKNQAERALRTLETQQDTALRQLREDLQSESGRRVRDLEQRLRDQEVAKQLELESLRASYAALKAQSQEEIRRLWSQLESPGPDGQDPSAFHDQLPARTPHGEEREHRRQDPWWRQQREESVLESAQVSAPRVFLEERTGEGSEHLEGPRLQPELEENHRSPSSLEARQEVGLEGTPVLEGEQHVGLSEGPSEELARAPLPCVQDVASQVETEVAARVLGLETEHKLKLSLLQTELKEEIDVLKLENRNLHEKLQHAISLKEDLERVKRDLVEDLQEELKKAKEKLELMKRESRDKEAGWKVASEILKRKAEEELALALLHLREQAEAERQSLMTRFELRELEMRQLQDQQAAQIRDLEGSLVEQQGRLRQLELGLTGEECPQCGREPGGRPAPADQGGELATLRLKEDCALQLMQARNRFLKERKEITEKFAAEQDALLRETQEKHSRELRLLQERHQQHVLSLTAELEAVRRSEQEELRASVEGEQRALAQAREAELQAGHVAALRALEARHLSHLDSLESRHRSEVQALREQHHRALEQLSTELGKQRQHKDASRPAALTGEQGQELPPADGGLTAQMDADPGASGVTLLYPELLATQQGEFEGEKKAALHEQEEIPRLESEQAQSLHRKEEESLFLQLQEKNDQILRLKDQILSLSQEVEECHSELEKLQQRRERENQEGTNLISMLKSDIDLSDRERRALRDALRRLLTLFGETLRAAVTLKSRIGERVGLCLADEGLPDARPSGQALLAAPVLDETWPASEAALLELDRTLPECAEVSSEAEISSHICESFFMSPESSLECEQPVRKLYRSLGLAVDGLLELALDSTRQLEEARQIHCRFEKEFSCKNEETAQVVRKHQELLERLEEASTARKQLVLELHQAQGIIEGFKVEKASLQEVLGQKETAEQGLAVELESLKQQLQWAAQQQAELKEENSILCAQKEALAAEAEEREAALRREVDGLTQEQAEARKQAEKDRAALLSQMKVFEVELEEQLARQEASAQQAGELCALRQQLAALDKHLRSQRHFMDEQAVEREHEREEFQREIQRLEEQLRQVARPRPRGSCISDQEQLDEEVKLLQEKLREKSDGFNELAAKKELVDRQMLVQEEEIRRLEETNASCRREAAALREELERQRDAVKALQQDKEALEEQQRSQLPLMSTLQPVPPAGSRPEGPEVQSDAVQRVLRQREHEVLDLKEQLEKIKDDLACKSDEVLHLNSKLEAQSSRAARAWELQEENTSLQVLQDRSSEVEELRSIIENLRENQRRLQREKAEETERLHEVIERLQRELSLGGPAGPGAEGGQLPAVPAVGPEALAAAGAVGQLLAEQECRHSQALEGQQQRLRAAEEAAATQLAELERCAARGESEVQGLASQIQAFEAALEAKEARIAERDSEIDAMKRQKLALSAEMETLLAAFSRFRLALEQQPLAMEAEGEPPELRRLRAQCVRLGRQLQRLHLRFLSCQGELDGQQAQAAHRHPSVEGRPQGQGPRAAGASWDEESQLPTDPQGQAGDTQCAAPEDSQPAKAPGCFRPAALHRQDSVMSVLAACQKHLQSELLLAENEMHVRTEDHSRGPGGLQNKGELLEDCQLRKVGLLSQVKELQEKLNHLLYSVNSQNTETEDFRLQQPVAPPRALENSWSDHSDNGEETEKSLVDTSHIEKTTCDLTDLRRSQDPLIKNEMSDVPEQDQVDLQDGSPCLQAGFHGGFRDLAHPERPAPLKNALRAMDLSSWSSPEVVRKDSTLEPAPSLPLTPCSDALSLDASLRDRTSSSLQADQAELLGYLGGSAAGAASGGAASPVAADKTPSADRRVQWVSVEKDVEDFIVTSLDAQEKPRTCPLGFEGKNNGSENSDGSGFGEILNRGSGRLETPTASPTGPPPTSGRFGRPLEAMKEKEIHPKQVKALLQMVCDESHHILALSERHGPPSTLSKGEPSAPLECFPRAGSGILEAVPALRRHATLALQKGEKEPPNMCLDWRGEFLQVVQEAFGKEWEVLRAELQPQPCAPDPGDHNSLMQRLEKVVQEQEKSLEHLRLSDRSSLLAEIQALRAQLRMTHLQNQEKLQQLCGALTSAEAHGSRQEHQLRRQVELLAYKVEQEKRIASDVQKTLKEEQEKAGSTRKLLAVEQTAVRDLRAELRECKQDNERLLASLSEAQKEVLQLRSVLDGKESSLKAALQELECERGKERALRSRLEEQRLRHLHEEGQSSKTLEELRTALEQQCAQSSRLRVALEHEQTAADNLRRELQIEASRCEALLAQERGQLCELQRSLEAEKGRSRELAAALRHEQLLTEQLSRGAREPPVQHAPPRRPRDERARVPEPQARLEQMQRRRAAELERDKEVRAAHSPGTELPPAQEPRLIAARPPAGLECAQARPAAREGRKDVRRRAETGPGRADMELRPSGDKEKRRELELQRQRDEHKIRQLQRTVQALEAKEAARQAPEAEWLQEERLGLEKVRQQLLYAAGLLTSFVSRTVDRTISDWTSSNEKAVTSLLRTLEELKSELSTPGPSQRKMTAELQTQLVDVLLKDNDSLTTALRTVTQEKAELCRAVSQLEKSLKQHLLRRGVCSVEKLYLHYLRAESFRKALIYQKKYLLLLIGGFQDSEQETLSMIAHLGVFPSKADKKITPSRPFTKFRTAVRVVIAILRLRFLVKKWQEVDGKGAIVPGRAPRPGVPVPRQQPPPKTSTSPPTRDASSSHAGDRVPKASLRRRERSTPSPDSRSERSLTASQDPERSLTEYIHHLEMVQQRLGGAPPDSASKKSCRQKIKQ
ncbi:pericentrin isoform X2 [Enhydra lutris kenyoni]|uniref:Pericentrin isoform X2 n=1 Tax=Enhydra lutris kenyoni TaxID=391180 RepID=A0A2Y9KFJ2_ENHLU|nr:pericentrin isoform X2 [Enhydra lutris kenyoni]